jgi:hypothetical protein
MSGNFWFGCRTPLAPRVPSHVSSIFTYTCHASRMAARHHRIRRTSSCNSAQVALIAFALPCCPSATVQPRRCPLMEHSLAAILEPPARSPPPWCPDADREGRRHRVEGLANPPSFTIGGVQRLSVDPETRALSFRTGDAPLLWERVARRLIVVVPVIACAGSGRISATHARRPRSGSLDHRHAG